MKNIALFTIALLVSLPTIAQWKPAGNKIKTEWGSKIDPNHVLAEYPRPIMERSEWQNLNGLWDYAIKDKGAVAPEKFDGKILVPFAVESSLSGVMKEVGALKELWYNTTFKVPENWNGKDILLHFGAVDWKAEVWLNDVKIGSHTGGYVPFLFNITPFIIGSAQKLTVKVWDPSSDGPQPRGKQVVKPEGIWYTPVTGIWQTVWIEPVAKKSISNIKTVPDIDNGIVKITPAVVGATYGDIIEVTVREGGKTISTT